jgi:two-component system, cell cycle response regulator
MGDNSSIDKILEAEILPSLPTVALKILSLNPETAANDMARVITFDVSLTARIIKAANSPYFAQICPVTSIQRAIAILGNRQVLALSLAASLTPPPDGLLNFSRFWEAALSTAITTRHILKVSDPWCSEEGFTAGLLADLGVILLASAHPEQYRTVLELNQKTETPTGEIEKEIFGFNCTELGVAAAKRWNFPPSFQAVIEHHHDPQKFSGDAKTKFFILAVHLGEIVTDLFYSAQYDQLKSEFLAGIDENLDLQHLSFDELARDVAEELQQASTWMGINLTVERAIEWVYRNHIEKLRANAQSLPRRSSAF